MINGFYYSYGTPMMNYVNSALVTGIAATVAAVLGVVLYYTFFRKSNEGRFYGFKEKLYNLMTFNRFYAEDMLKFLYIILTCAVTAAGIAQIVLGSFVAGITILVVANLAIRLGFELVMMFIMLCRKTVSMDRKLGRIAEYYDDGYGEFGGFGGREMTREEWEAMDRFESPEEYDDCSGDCGSCGGDCASFEEAEVETIINNIKREDEK